MDKKNDAGKKKKAGKEEENKDPKKETKTPYGTTPQSIKGGDPYYNNGNVTLDDRNF